jgi:outer membrane lipoprotein-sorting protein
MRWLTMVAGWLLLAPLVQAQEPAQKLFEAMEQKLGKAKALKVGIAIESEEGGEALKVKGTLILAAGNRMKLTMEGKGGKESIQLAMISDGKKLVTQSGPAGKPETENKAVHDKLFDLLVGYVSRAGLFIGVDAVDRADAKPASTLKLSDFKTIGKEKVEGREANVIEYQITHIAGKVITTCKLWLDAQTNLPLKRSLSTKRDDIKLVSRVDEMYIGWEMDPQLPEGTFTLPK